MPKAKKPTKKQLEKARIALLESLELDKPKDQRQAEAGYFLPIKKMIDDPNGTYEQGAKFVDKCVKVYEFTLDELKSFAKGLQMLSAGIINEIEKREVTGVADAEQK